MEKDGCRVTRGANVSPVLPRFAKNQREAKLSEIIELEKPILFFELGRQAERAAQPHFGGQKLPDVSPLERRISVLTTRIRKLQWMGLENEAAKLTFALSHIDPHAICVSYPVDTD